MLCMLEAVLIASREISANEIALSAVKCSERMQPVTSRIAMTTACGVLAVKRP